MGKKGARPSDPGNAEVRAMDRLLAEKPPIIMWRKNNHGVLIHVFIDDPHAENIQRTRLDIEEAAQW